MARSELDLSRKRLDKQLKSLSSIEAILADASVDHVSRTFFTYKRDRVVASLEATRAVIAMLEARKVAESKQVDAFSGRTPGKPKM